MTQYTGALMAQTILSLLTGLSGRTRPLFNITISNVPAAHAAHRCLHRRCLRRTRSPDPRAQMTARKENGRLSKRPHVVSVWGG